MAKFFSFSGEDVQAVMAGVLADMIWGRIRSDVHAMLHLFPHIEWITLADMKEVDAAFDSFVEIVNRVTTPKEQRVGSDNNS